MSLFGRKQAQGRPLPGDFLEWQVALRHHTMVARQGSPHVGVVPLVTVRRPGAGLGVMSHSVICGLLPRPEDLEAKTKEFRSLYEEGIADGAQAVYDRGIEYLLGYYQSPADFDPESVTTLLPESLPLVEALRADPRCALVFHVFDLEDKSLEGRLRCLQLDCTAEIHAEGPVYDNVWWHNALFHGAADGCVVIRFVHQRTHDTLFGRLEPMVDPGS